MRCPENESGAKSSPESRDPTMLGLHQCDPKHTVEPDQLGSVKAILHTGYVDSVYVHYFGLLWLFSESVCSFCVGYPLLALILPVRIDLRQENSSRCNIQSLSIVLGCSTWDTTEGSPLQCFLTYFWFEVESSNCVVSGVKEVAFDLSHSAIIAKFLIYLVSILNYLEKHRTDHK